MRFNFLQPVPVAARDSVGRKLQQFANCLERVLMPDLQHDDFTLFARQLRQTTHGRPFLRRLALGSFEPSMRFQFPRHATPKTAAVIQRPVPKTAQTVMKWFFRRLRLLHQRHERLLQDIFGLAVAQAQRPAVKEDLGGAGLVETLTPMVRFCRHTCTQ